MTEQRIDYLTCSEVIAMSDFLRAARYTPQKSPKPHQAAAWTWAWRLLSKEQQAEFLEMFRADPPDKEPQTANTWQGVANLAKAEGAKWPQLVAAQWALESDWGKRPSGAHNYFGLKGLKGATRTTTEVIGGEEVSTEAVFLDFDSLAASVRYLVGRWYRDWDGYEGINRAATIEQAAAQLKTQGYATDPRYDDKLLDLVRRNSAPTGRKLPGFDEHLTRHFRVGEFALDQAARAFREPYQVETARLLAQFLERVRARFNGAVVITSGYRPVEINRKVGGAAGSEHLYDRPGMGAVDFYVDGADIHQVQDWVDSHWPHSVGYGAAKGFVHLGVGRGRRRWNY